MNPTERDWRIRRHIYAALAAGGRAPDAAAIATCFAISQQHARGSLRRLHDAHALVLQPGGDAILMAHPLSAVPTDYRVTVAGARLYANCAWDSLGIPAMLDSDATIQARHPLGENTLSYSIEGGRLCSEDDLLVHFAHPFRRWYDDIVET